MITGDHELTAKAIAKQLGIITSGKTLSWVEQNGCIIRKEFSDIVEHVRVYARVNPEQK
jgi:Ca2+-transporting ATPase